MLPDRTPDPLPGPTQGVFSDPDFDPAIEWPADGVPGRQADEICPPDQAMTPSIANIEEVGEW
jgi:hypothetical protein